MEYLLILVFGWPAAILGAALLAGGIAFGNPKLSFAGALAATGFCVYLMMNPTSLKWWAAVAALCNYGSALFIRRRALRWAALLLLPYFWTILVVANAMLSPESAVARSFGDKMWVMERQHVEVQVLQTSYTIGARDREHSDGRL